MKRYRANGAHIKELRESRERAATQKEFAYEVQISERLLRQVENANAALKADVLERIAKALGVPWPAIVFSPDGPRPVPAPVNTIGSEEPAAEEECATITAPRFDTDFARAVYDEATLFAEARDNHVVVSHIMTMLNSDTECYVDELLDVLESVTRGRRGSRAPIDGREELRLRRRLRELLVLLKGNDVWVYSTTHMKFFPESNIPADKRDWSKVQTQVIVAFGPPGEYGETTLKVPIDHGQPWIYNRTAKLPF